MYQYELSDEEFPSECIPLVVAAMEDCSQRKLDPLGNQIDPDALNQLLAYRSPDGVRVSFRYSGYEVTVSPDEIRFADGHPEHDD